MFRLLLLLFLTIIAIFVFIMQTTRLDDVVMGLHKNPKLWDHVNATSFLSLLVITSYDTDCTSVPQVLVMRLWINSTIEH